MAAQRDLFRGVGTACVRREHSDGDGSSRRRVARRGTEGCDHLARTVPAPTMSPIVVPNDGPMSGKIKGGSFSGEDTLLLTQPSLAVRPPAVCTGSGPSHSRSACRVQQLERYLSHTTDPSSQPSGSTHRSLNCEFRIQSFVWQRSESDPSGSRGSPFTRWLKDELHDT